MSNKIIEQSIGLLFIAYVGFMALSEMVNASAVFTGVVGTITGTVLPIIAAVAFLQVIRGRSK